MRKHKSLGKITLSKGGSKQRTIALEDLEIPDMWAIAHREHVNLRDKKAILHCWHLAHDLRRALVAARKEALDISKNGGKN